MTSASTIPTIPDDLVDVPTIARLLNCSSQTVRNHIAKGTLPAYALPIGLRLSYGEIADLIASRRTTAMMQSTPLKETITLGGRAL